MIIMPADFLHFFSVSPPKLWISLHITFLGNERESRPILLVPKGEILGHIQTGKHRSDKAGGRLAGGLFLGGLCRLGKEPPGIGFWRRSCNFLFFLFGLIGLLPDEFGLCCSFLANPL